MRTFHETRLRARRYLRAVLACTVLVLCLDTPPADAHRSAYAHTHRSVAISDQQRAENMNHGYVRVMERWHDQRQWDCLNRLWSPESGWNHRQWNHGGSSAYGIPQAMTKTHRLEGTPYMGTPYGSDGLDGIVYQINWGLSYIAGRYGTPCQALAYKHRRGWY